MLFKKRKGNPDLNLTPEAVLHSWARALVKLPKFFEKKILSNRQGQGIFKGKLFPTTRPPRVRQTLSTKRLFQNKGERILKRFQASQLTRAAT